MAARRCSVCGTNWPNSPKYTVCPEDGMTTQIMWTVEAISVEEAQRRKAYADFDDFLAERERDAVAQALIEDALS